MQKRASRLKLKDLANFSEPVKINTWELPDPERTYHASALSVAGHGREVSLTFAQVSPGSLRRVVSAVSVSMPRSVVVEALKGFDAIRERLKRLEFREDELNEVTLDPKALDSLEAQAFLDLRADIIRGVCGDDTAVLDFFSGPLISDALKQARPDSLLDFRAQIRVTCSSLVLSALLASGDAEVSQDGD